MKYLPIAAILLTACGTQREALNTVPDLRGYGEGCETIMSNLHAASTAHKKLAVSHSLKSNAGTIGAVVGGVFTFGLVPLGYMAYKMTFPNDGGTGDAYREWEHWYRLAGYKGCGKGPVIIPVKGELIS